MLDPEIKRRVEEELEHARRHTEEAIRYMARYGIKPSGEVRLFYPPSFRKREIDRIPFNQPVKEKVVYRTEPGEFSAVCPFSGLPDYGVLTVEYVPGSWILELKSFKYYIVSFRQIGVTQEEVTAIIYQYLLRHLEDPDYLVVETVYNVRGGIRTTVRIDSREQDESPKEVVE